MARRSYPEVNDWEQLSTENYFPMAGRKCAECPHVFGKNEKFWRRETRVSYFRGEDECYDICQECKAKKL
jgi:hypothetical protein